MELWEYEKAVRFCGYNALAAEIGDKPGNLRARLNGYLKFTMNYEERVVVGLHNLGIIKLLKQISHQLTNKNKYLTTHLSVKIKSYADISETLDRFCTCKSPTGSTVSFWTKMHKLCDKTITVTVADNGCYYDEKRGVYLSPEWVDILTKKES